jgi:CRISPR-associated endonuclease/helicase Cas3
VRRAQALFEALEGAECEVVLVHSRFRKADRDERMKQLSVDPPVQGRIIVATQALEAGVDVTSATMITEIAPWSSLVQRFGRCNRGGECRETGSDIFWVDLPDAETNPYSKEDFENARGILEELFVCGPSDLAIIPPSLPQRAAVIRKRDMLDLFDTDPDLSGFDVDVSLYVRDADDTDVRLFWRRVEEGGPPEDASGPAREELCPAPIAGAKELLNGDDVSAWRWDGLAKRWRRTGKRDVFPGMTIWIDCKCGGYDTKKGFDPEARNPVEPVPLPDSTVPEPAFESDAETPCDIKVSLIRHSAHVRDQARCLIEELRVSGRFDGREGDSLIEAALWHDLGKGHDVFKARCGLADDEIPLAKTPEYNWRKPDPRNRKNFRHELASALAFLAARQWKEEASLTAYLIAAHHGKLRMRLRALPNDRSAQTGKLFARGVVDGDVLPETALDGITVPATALDLDIMGSERGRVEQAGRRVLRSF